VPLFPEALRVLRGYARLVSLAIVIRAYGILPLPSFKARRLTHDVIERLPFRFIY